MERKSYGSDLTREQYEVIKPVLENARKKTRPRQVDLYDVLCAILYVLKEGCRWRALPHDFPRWDRVYKYFQQWSAQPGEGEPSLLEQAFKKSGERRAYRAWTTRKDELLHRGCTKREEYGHSARERV
jgi:transposase